MWGAIGGFEWSNQPVRPVRARDGVCSTAMTLETYSWLRAGHVFGFVCWIAGMVTVLLLLRAHGTVEGPAREVLGRQEKKAAILMDAGATLAIVCGLWMAFGGVVSAFKTGAWLHVKLTLVAIVLLGVHGWSRVQIKRFRQGQVRHVSSTLILIVLVATAVIIALGANPTLLRKKGPAAPVASAPASVNAPAPAPL